jgi:acyl-CoA dehydrogenase
MDFEHSPETRDLADRVRDFVQEVVIPAEPRDHGVHGPEPELRAELQQAARAAGLFAPHMPAEFGGLGLDMRGQAVVFEEAGVSLLGALALNCAAPDEGNMAMLEKIATPEQKERYLAPLAAGDVRSCFAMTEPAPGAGSDPSMLRTSARPVDGGWVIDGDKWFITGAHGAGFAIVMARTGETVTRGRGATMFLVDTDNPGWHAGRIVDCMDRVAPGGHAEVELRDCFVPSEAILGEEGLGYQYAQVRLAPARLTHCMRWLGVARRAHEIAVRRAVEREGFGSRLSDLGMVQQMIADSAIDLQSSRMMIWHTAWLLDTGADAQKDSSMTKVHVAEAVDRVVDRSLQICGSLGTSGDLPLARFYNEIRAFRIYDGASEAHRWSIARREARAVTGPPATQAA